MAEIEIIEETPLTMSELKERLETIKKSQELVFRSNKTLEYLNAFTKINTKQAKEIKEKLKSLDIIRLKDKHIAKIIDLVPKDTETLKTILAQDNITVKTEDIEKILACLK
ncbi:MAG: hypothetical protein AABY07_08245 [Nanoarchaeota archaeon]